MRPGCCQHMTPFESCLHMMWSPFMLTQPATSCMNCSSHAYEGIDSACLELHGA